MTITKRMKRSLALGLCLVLLLALLPGASLAAETYTTSPEGLALSKEFEGFSAWA